MKTIIAFNTTTTDIELPSLGETIPVKNIDLGEDGSLVLSNYSAHELRFDNVLINGIQSGDIVINDGTDDLSSDIAIDYVSNETIADEDGFWYGKRRRFSILWNEPNHGYSAGNVIKVDENTGQSELAMADAHKNCATTAIVSEIVDENSFYAGITGSTVVITNPSVVEGGLPLEIGKSYFLSPVTPGVITRDVPVGAGQIIKLVGLALTDNEIMVFSNTGYENETALTESEALAIANGDTPIRAKNTWMRMVESMSVSDPSLAEKINGKRYIIGSNAVGDWAGLENHIAEYVLSTESWTYTAPEIGFTVVVRDVPGIFIYGEYNSWVPIGEDNVKRSGDVMSGDLTMHNSSVIFKDEQDVGSYEGDISQSGGDLIVNSPSIVNLTGNGIRFSVPGATEGSFVKVGPGGVLEFATIDEEETEIVDTDNTDRTLSGVDFQDIGLSVVMPNAVSSGSINVDVTATSSASTVIVIAAFVNGVQYGTEEQFNVYGETPIQATFPITDILNNGDTVEIKAKEFTGGNNITLLNSVYEASMTILSTSGIRLIAGNNITLDKNGYDITINSVSDGTSVPYKIFYGESQGYVQTIGSVYSPIYYGENLDFDPIYSHSVVNGGSRIQVNRDGKYLVRAEVSLINSKSAKKGITSAIFINGTMDGSSLTYSNFSKRTALKNTIHIFAVISLTSGDYIEIKTKTDNGAVSTLDDGCRIYIEPKE